MTRALARDAALRARAARVVPGGMYGHLNAMQLPAGFPQFFERAEGCRVWDVDGNEYLDLMCSFGPVVLGHRHPAVEAAAAKQATTGDCLNGPSPAFVELAERLVDTVDHADWAMFQKNGTDATTLCLTIARAATGRRKILTAHGSYHGAAPWCTPIPGGVTDEDRVNLLPFVYNDLESAAAAAAQAGGDLAGIIVCPHKHDVFVDQELVDPDFARGLRRLCNERGAALILDEVRTGFRIAPGGSWEGLGVAPDLSAWSKALGNGHPIAAVLGGEPLREAATRVFATGSFWFSAVPMVAALATLETLRREKALERMREAGTALRQGLAAQAASHGFKLRQTGPEVMPMVLFDDDPGFTNGRAWCAAAVRRGVYVHPFHNWFLCAAHDADAIRSVLERTDEAFGEVRRGQ